MEEYGLIHIQQDLAKKSHKKRVLGLRRGVSVLLNRDKISVGEREDLGQRH